MSNERDEAGDSGWVLILVFVGALVLLGIGGGFYVTWRRAELQLEEAKAAEQEAARRQAEKAAEEVAKPNTP